MAQIVLLYTIPELLTEADQQSEKNTPLRESNRLFDGNFRNIHRRLSYLDSRCTSEEGLILPAQSYNPEAVSEAYVDRAA